MRCKLRNSKGERRKIWCAKINILLIYCCHANRLSWLLGWLKEKKKHVSPFPFKQDTSKRLLRVAKDKENKKTYLLCKR